MNSPKQILDALNEEKRKEIILKICSLNDVQKVIDLLKTEGFDCDEKTAQSFLDVLSTEKLSDEKLAKIAAGGSPNIPLPYEYDYPKHHTFPIEEES